jgi:hypothetical protein
MRSFFGAALLGCGVLIAGLSGLCTLVLIGGSVGSSDTSILGIALLIGGVPCVLGIGMVFLGRRQIRKADEEARDRVQSDVFD